MTVAALETSVREPELDEQKTLDRIKRYIDHPPEYSRIFTVTPTIALDLLEFNLGNRPKKPGKIAKYAGSMSEGNWMLTGDTIKFSDARLLRDGQNRLMACIRANAPFRSHFVFGIPDSAFDRLDQGQNRNGADVLAIAGYQNTTALSGAVRWAHLIETGRAKQRDTYEPPEVLRLLRERYPDMPNFIGRARMIYENAGQPQAVVAGILYLLHRANELMANDFGSAWESANWDGRYKAIGLMQSRVASIRASTSGRVHDVVRAALIIKAWNIFTAGRKGRMSEMVWDTGDDFPVIER
jgi:hypothetical protein